MAWPFTLTIGSLPADAVRVLSWRGREAVSTCYRFDVRAVVDATLIAELDEQVGARATLSLVSEGSGDEARSISGVVRRVEVHSALTSGAPAHGAPEALARDARVVRAVLAPRLWLLSKRVTSRIFQDKTVPEIVGIVLDQASVPHREALAAKYRRRSYCVEHQESDLAFVTRLLAEEGIWYFFDQSGGDTVVLSDSEALYPPISGAPKLIAREQEAGALLHEEHDVFAFEASRSLRSGAVLCRDYDFRRPGLDPRAEASTAQTGAKVGASTPPPAGPAASGRAPSGDFTAVEAKLQVYKHHGEDELPDVSPRTASVLLEQLRHGAATVRGRSACPRLAPGLCFELAEHEVDALNGSYAVAAVEHEGRVDGAGEASVYANRFTCVRATVPLRPKAKTGRRLQQVSETAIVVGPPGQEVYTDELGRVKVQFHWDLGGKQNEQSSCWLRVVTPWAGAGYGFQLVPRVGMEVLVTFLGGDTDRPVIVGCLPNAANRPPFTLPAERTKSGIVTRSTPGGRGGSELSIEDAAGREVVTLRAERDLAESTGRDRELTVGRDERVTVKGRSTERVRRNKVVEVGGTLRQTAGGLASSARGNVTEHVGGRRAQTVDGSELLTVGKDAVVHVAGSYDVVVGIPGQDTLQHHAVTVEGDQVLTASRAITVCAATKLTLACGESTIELTPEGVKVRGKRVEVIGAEGTEIKGNGPRLTLGEDAELAAKRIRHFSEQAQLVLDKDAKLSGAMVYINSPDDPARPRDGAATAETQPFKTKLSDAEYGVWAQKRYQLRVDGLTIEGTTDAEGLVDKAIPKDATSVTMVVWFGEYPTGQTKTRTIRLGPIAPTSTPRGAAVRLAHLGYFHGEPPDALDDPLRAAVKDFQGHVGLATTGALDEATVAKIDATHGK